MSMWYDVDGVLILKDSVCPAFTLIDVAKPWIVASPIPLTTQSLCGSPGSWFSHAIALPQAAAAGRAPTKGSRPTNTASTPPMTKRADTRRPVPNMSAPHKTNIGISPSGTRHRLSWMTGDGHELQCVGLYPSAPARQAVS